ncbi:MAG: hypothetical protein B7X57_09130 [Erythrobacter sp. 34-65-8]|nr:MAG: hypothetical protein B7X57_09130 [Erythrobacter sp. 34-65-8]
MNIAKLALIPAALLAFAPAALAAPPAVGATVYGPQGGEVGKVEQVDGQTVILDTGKHKVPLGVDAFGQGETGPTITVTRAQLDTMMDQQLAEAAAARDAALVPGTAVVSADSQPIGTIESVENDNVVLAMNDQKVALMREHFAVTETGLMALFTSAQLQEAIAKAASGA